MASMYRYNVVAYNKATQIVNDTFFDEKEEKYDDIDEDSDADSDGISITVRHADDSKQTGQKGDESNDSSEDNERYVDPMTSRSEDTITDDDGNGLFVDAEEENSRESLDSFASFTETNEELELENAVAETLDKIMDELLKSEELASSDQHSAAGEDRHPNETNCLPSQNGKLSLTASACEMVANQSNSELSTLEDMNGEVEFYDSYAVFNPYDGGQSVVCSIGTERATEPEIGTSSEMLGERSSQISDRNNPFSYQDYNYVNTPEFQSVFEPSNTDNFVDAPQFLPGSNNLENASAVHYQPPNAFDNQFSTMEERGPIQGSLSDSDPANKNEMKNLPESPYIGQDGDNDISYTHCENHIKTVDTWYDPLTQADDVDTSPLPGIFENADRMTKNTSQIQNETFHSDVSNKPAVFVSTSADVKSFPKSSLNPNCEPFVPMQNPSRQVYELACPTTESHSGALPFGGPPHLPIYNDHMGYANFKEYTFGVPGNTHAANIGNGYFPQIQETMPYYGPGHNAYPVCPRNMTPSNPNFCNQHSSLQPTDLNQHLQYHITPSNTGSKTTDFRYPAIYLSDAGLITVLLRHDFSVEMTVDQVIRVVNHKKKLVALVNGQGTDCYVFHPAAKITQDMETVEVEVFLQRKVKMTTENIVFANNFKCYKFDHDDIEEAEPIFSDLRNDLSVDFLFSLQSCSGHDDMIQRAVRLSEEAEIEHNENGWSVVKVNGVKIIQNERGEVTVNSGPKFIRMYPNNMSLQLKSNFLEVRIGINWSVKVSRGSHVLNASHCGFIVTNGRIEAGFDDVNKPFACLLPRRVPLLSGHRKLRRRYGSGTHLRQRKQNDDN
ncbi:uncharacterized protein [Argopecten irradians]|uniref:uncharacterized protein n=1 Tax=Argopecten irradians TaxID=31199 RepID=UPI003715FA25